MSLDSVQPGLSNQAVHPGQDAHDDRKPDPREEGKPKRLRKNLPRAGKPQAVFNILGEVIGQALDVTA